jgi:hypothetical protein
MRVQTPWGSFFGLSPVYRIGCVLIRTLPSRTVANPTCPYPYPQRNIKSALAAHEADLKAEAAALRLGSRKSSRKSKKRAKLGTYSMLLFSVSLLLCILQQEVASAGGHGNA